MHHRETTSITPFAAGFSTLTLGSKQANSPKPRPTNNSYKSPELVSTILRPMYQGVPRTQLKRLLSRPLLRQRDICQVKDVLRFPLGSKTPKNRPLHFEDVVVDTRRQTTMAQHKQRRLADLRLHQVRNATTTKKRPYRRALPSSKSISRELPPPPPPTLPSLTSISREVLPPSAEEEDDDDVVGSPMDIDYEDFVQ